MILKYSKEYLNILNLCSVNSVLSSSLLRHSLNMLKIAIKIDSQDHISFKYL
jgi:hypothetical protein